MNIEIKKNFEIKISTSFKIGGSIERAYFPETIEEMEFLLETLENPLVLGNCSNLIFSSNGIDGDVIFTKNIKEMDFSGEYAWADCGVKGQMFAKQAVEHSLSGVEFMIGFPGSIGGNVYMNASASGQSTAESIDSVLVYDIKNKCSKTLSKEELDFSYRHSICQDKDYIVLRAFFNLKKDDRNGLNTMVEEILKFRREHQPTLSIPNAGSIFRNPEGTSAGRLLDELGAKSWSVGGAKVWENHANFIVNFNNATSLDVLELMLKMQNAVLEKNDIKLKPEVKFVGKKTKREAEICKILYEK